MLYLALTIISPDGNVTRELHDLDSGMDYLDCQAAVETYATDTQRLTNGVIVVQAATCIPE